MNNAPLLLVGPRCGDRVTGVRLCFDLLIEALATADVPHYVVDTTAGHVPKRPGTVRTGRALEMLRLLPGIWRRILTCRTVYLTLSTSRPGSLRDALVIWPAALARRRIVGHLHGGGYAAFYATQPALLRWILRKTLRRADALVVLAESLRDQFAFDPSLEARITVVGNSLPFPRPVEWPDQKTLNAGEPLRILYLSNMIVSKGYLLLLDACRQLVHEHGVSLRVDFCGEFVDTIVENDAVGETSVTFNRRLIDAGLESVARWRGVVGGAQKNALLANAHVLVLPTHYPWEGQPICVIEALASATPVIASRHRAIPEMLNDGVEGRLVPVRDSGAIADAVLGLIINNETYAQASAAAMARYEREFRRERHTSAMLDVLLP